MIKTIYNESIKFANDMDLPQHRLFDCECMHMASKVGAFAFCFFSSSAVWAYLEITR